MPDTIASLLEQVDAWRKKGKLIAFTNGCFDVLHIGHISTLTFAKSRCHRLIVGIDDDDSVRMVKGEDRPIFPAAYRVAMLKAMRAVDAVIVFNDFELDSVVAEIKPDMLVKGGEYKGSGVVGARHAGKVLYAPMVNGVSTSHILRRAVSCTSLPEELAL